MRKRYLAIDGKEFKSKKKAAKHSKKLLAECFSFNYFGDVINLEFEDDKYTEDFNLHPVDSETTIDRLLNLMESILEEECK